MLSDWWNGVELWVAGLPFPFQFALVVVVLVPLCLVVAWLIDRVVDHASAFFGPARHPEPPLDVQIEDTESAEPAETADEVEEPAGDEPVTGEPAAKVARVPAESTGR
ncbi:MAG TPA: hypothetical protein VH969_05500 [Actinophytocola sp.]|jgi:hypothetical protein|uniref:hypothetical protein n=1 Tax=Actinophytocola sp. TaxID=1872138 RepID=UPI002F92733C